MSPKSKNAARPKERPEPIGKEIKGVVLLLVAVILGVSLFSYHPGDPSFWVKAGATGKVHNLFGAFGANLAGGIFLLFGFSSFWLIAVSLALSFFSFRGDAFTSPLKGFLSVLFLILSFAGASSMKFPEVVGFGEGRVLAGGLVGDHIAHFSKGYLSTFGTYVFLFAVFIIAFMVCTRLSFSRFFSAIALRASGMIRGIRSYSTKKRERRRKRRVREESLKSERTKGKPKVTIIAPPKEASKKQEQEAFPFMKASDEFKLPPLDLLDDTPESEELAERRESLQMNARRLERKLSDFGVEGSVVEILPGPVITMYEFSPAPGIKISKVSGLADDLTMALRAPSVRIVAPIPGKDAIGIEIANNKRDPVYLKEVLSSQAYQESDTRLTMALGKDITGLPVVTDLTRMPHLLVAGATGTGKSVSLNAMINSILFKLTPDTVRFLMIDPKRIELSVYKDIPHLLHPVVTEPKEATRLLRWTVEEMERRYALLSDRGVRNIDAFNRKVLKEEKGTAAEGRDGLKKPLPYIVFVIDELADLMMISSREVEEAITRLAQMARAAGIHLIIATQRPSVDVLTGIIKANFPTRISFQVSSKVDSRTILDTIGAEHLLGNGDMLFMPPGVGRLTRIHGAYVSEKEVKRVTDFLKEQMKPEYDSAILEEVTREEEDKEVEDIISDEKYDAAIELVVQTRQASISMLQRRLRVGYNRAARMIEAMEKQGIVGPSDGIRPREVYGRGSVD